MQDIFIQSEVIDIFPKFKMAACGLGKEPPKKEEKKTPPDSGKLAIRPDHPRCRMEVKVCMPGGLRCVVLYLKFY